MLKGKSRLDLKRRSPFALPATHPLQPWFTPDGEHKRHNSTQILHSNPQADSFSEWLGRLDKNPEKEQHLSPITLSSFDSDE